MSSAGASTLFTISKANMMNHYDRNEAKTMAFLRVPWIDLRKLGIVKT
jgi:hypothetical protein